MKTPTHGRLDYKSFYGRKLPDIQPPNATLFVKLRLAGSLPGRAVKRMADDLVVFYFD